MTVLLETHGLTKTFVSRRNAIGRAVETVRAVDDVSLQIDRGETLGLVGESGCGKSTLGRLIMSLIRPDAGRVTYDDVDLSSLTKRSLDRVRRNIQMIFQDPYGCLDPTKAIVDAVGEPLKIHFGTDRDERRRRVIEVLERVGLGEEHLHRYPFEFSGGQRQRIAIARALTLDPSLIVCDEPVSALDLSTQAQVVNLLRQMQDESDVGYLFISHDLSLVRHVSHRIAVMYLGSIVEEGPALAVADRPLHPYTEALLSSIPVPSVKRQHERERIRLDGEAPSAADPPTGCRFHTRCPYVMDECRSVAPSLETWADGRRVACHLHSSGPALAGESVVTLNSTKRTPDKELAS